MKYLKKFNESKLGDELEAFCQEYLAYLTDGKFECYVNSNDANTHITILNRDYNDVNFPGKGRRFYWNEIEDDFIPFLQILSERYVITYSNVGLNSYEPQVVPNQFNKVFSIKDVIDGKVPEYASCTGVTLQINRKIGISDIR
jgi:hypothetical protein